MRSLRHIILVERGSALMNATLAMAVVGGIGAAMMSSNQAANKTMKSNFVSDDMKDMSAQITRLLSNSQGCSLMFNGLNARNSTPVTVLTDHTGLTVLDTTTKFGTSNVSFESVRLQDLNDPGDDVAVVNGGAGSTNAIVKFKTVAKTTYENRNQVVKIRTRVITDASGNVTSCFAMNASDTLWTRETPSDNINYATGNVGIGVITPTEKLDVSGFSYVPPRSVSVSTTTPGGRNFTLGGTATEYQLGVSVDRPVVLKAASGAQRGTLVANNAIATQTIFIRPVAGGGPVCSPALEGAMRSKEIVIRPNAFRGQNALTVIRTQVCTDFEPGNWKWRTLKLDKFTIGGSAPCSPSLAQKNCTDHTDSGTHQ